MWMLVTNASTGNVITNARFNYQFYNRGDGYYYVYIGWNQSFVCSATGYNSIWGSTDSYSSMWIALSVYTPPPPPSSSSCWT
ncbi:MAG TPA: hypothetical protein VFZ66_15520 [Herpetosiphonaceae bacterium]